MRSKNLIFQRLTEVIRDVTLPHKIDTNGSADRKHGNGSGQCLTTLTDDNAEFVRRLGLSHERQKQNSA